MYYVYAYLDPRNPGQYDYKDCSFAYEPFYIGKGTGERCYFHTYEAKNSDQNTHKLNKIRSILSEGLEPIILIVKNDMIEDDAYQYEESLVRDIGMVPAGPLTNNTLGGRAPSVLYLYHSVSSFL
jgi:hypothetical protein